MSIGPACEGCTNFRGQDILQERLGYKPGTQGPRFASGSPQQHCPQEIVVSWSGSMQVHMEWENTGSTRQKSSVSPHGAQVAEVSKSCSRQEAALTPGADCLCSLKPPARPAEGSLPCQLCLVKR